MHKQVESTYMYIESIKVLQKYRIRLVRIIAKPDGHFGHQCHRFWAFITFANSFNVCFALSIWYNLPLSNHNAHNEHDESIATLVSSARSL